MKKSKFVSSVTYDHNASMCFEYVEGKSMTVTGESYTVRELFERHLQGQMPNVRDESYWEDTQDFDAIDFQALKHADPFEKAQLLENVQIAAAKAQEALERYAKEQADLHDSDDDSSSSSPNPKSKSKSGSKRGGEASDKERSDAERANSPSDDSDE